MLSAPEMLLDWGTAGAIGSAVSRFIMYSVYRGLPMRQTLPVVRSAFLMSLQGENHRSKSMLASLMSGGFFKLGLWIFSFIAGLAIVGSCLAQDEIASGLIAHWNFKEGAGDTVK